MATRKQMLTELYKENGLEQEDVFKHKHYVIITRSGIDKIQAKQQINVDYDVIKCEPGFSVIKAMASHNGRSIQTFGSALHGDYKKGNTNSHYVIEMAEKRAMSRAVLKLAGFYELGAYSEDESEEFAKAAPTASQAFSNKVNRMKKNLDDALKDGDIEYAISIYDEAESEGITQVCDYYSQIFNIEKETA
ncbi:hypothetical protein HN803_07160 [candidate division WWE3 bacterium]|jgi:hypothetical protein|nr:hypothetical protein [candidate division WWE3 bacterium]